MRGARASRIDPKRFAPTEKGEETKLESDRVLGGKTTLSFSLAVKQSEGEVTKVDTLATQLAQAMEARKLRQPQDPESKTRVVIDCLLKK